MKQPGALVALIIFVAAVSFVVAKQDGKNRNTITTTLTGANEVNSIGDADGGGIFRLTVKSEEQQLCYEMTASNIATATSVTINSDDRNTNDAVVLNLNPPANGRSQGCVASKPETLADISANPAHYYVNVSTNEFPNGAIRGHLGR